MTGNHQYYINLNKMGSYIFKFQVLVDLGLGETRLVQPDCQLKILVAGEQVVYVSLPLFQLLFM